MACYNCIFVCNELHSFSAFLLRARIVRYTTILIMYWSIFFWWAIYLYSVYFPELTASQLTEFNIQVINFIIFFYHFSWWRECFIMFILKWYFVHPVLCINYFLSFVEYYLYSWILIIHSYAHNYIKYIELQ